MTILSTIMGVIGIGADAADRAIERASVDLERGREELAKRRSVQASANAAVQKHSTRLAAAARRYDDALLDDKPAAIEKAERTRADVDAELAKAREELRKASAAVAESEAAIAAAEQDLEAATRARKIGELRARVDALPGGLSELAARVLEQRQALRSTLAAMDAAIRESNEAAAELRELGVAIDDATAFPTALRPFVAHRLEDRSFGAWAATEVLTRASHRLTPPPEALATSSTLPRRGHEAEDMLLRALDEIDPKLDGLARLIDGRSTSRSIERDAVRDALAERSSSGFNRVLQEAKDRAADARRIEDERAAARRNESLSDV